MAATIAAGVAIATLTACQGASKKAASAEPRHRGRPAGWL